MTRHLKKLGARRGMFGAAVFAAATLLCGHEAQAQSSWGSDQVILTHENGCVFMRDAAGNPLRMEWHCQRFRSGSFDFYVRTRFRCNRQPYQISGNDWMADASTPGRSVSCSFEVISEPADAIQQFHESVQSSGYSDGVCPGFYKIWLHNTQGRGAGEVENPCQRPKAED